MDEGRKKYGFPATQRLRKKQDFAAMRRGRRLQSRAVRLIYRRNGLAYARVGFAVSRRYGNAVARHRLKRHWREAFRQHAVRGQGVDILLIPLTDEAHMFAERGGAQAQARALFDRLSARLSR